MLKQPAPNLQGRHQCLSLVEVLRLQVGHRRRLEILQAGTRAQLAHGPRRALVGDGSEALHVFVGFLKGSVFFLVFFSQG